MPQAVKSRTVLWLCAGLLTATFAAFWPTLRAEFVNFDDADYVTENRAVLTGLNGASIQWAFTAVVSANWHPVTLLSHMLDVELFGRNAAGHHFTSLLLHAVNAVLVFLLFRQMTGTTWRSVLVAALFALHPLRVESVAWVSERKDVLCAFFGLLTLIAYARYVAESTVHGPKSKVWYGLALVCFALGLMSKPMLVTWPFVMLLLDWWPLGRVARMEAGRWKVDVRRCRSLVTEKLPFFALTVASALITFLMQQRAGATSGLAQLSLSDRAANALVSYARYLGKTFWPVDLAAYYPHPVTWPTSAVAGSVLLLAIVTVGVVRWHRQGHLAVGWFWFVGTLVPVIGLVQVGSQSMADRYTYIPAIGLGLGLIWLGAEAGGSWRWSPKLMAGGTVIGLLLLGWLTHRQTGYWQNSEKLFRHALAVTRDNYIGHLCLGNILVQQGQLGEGRTHLERARELNPTLAQIHGALASLANREGRHADAIAGYQEALKHPPTSPEVLNNLAWLRATCPDAQYRDGSEAVKLAERACELTGFERPLYIGTLAAAFAEAGKFTDAIAAARRAHDAALVWGETNIANRNLELMELYQKGQAFHEPKN